MSAELLIANFLRIAAEDLEGARLLAAAHNRNAIYLCEQAAEKIVRAVVTSENKHAGIKHDLAEMVDLIDDANPRKASLRAIEHLSQYATAYRYPVTSSRAEPAAISKCRRRSPSRRSLPSPRLSATLSDAFASCLASEAFLRRMRVSTGTSCSRTLRDISSASNMVIFLSLPLPCGRALARRAEDAHGS
jgi:HEPN domain-containing protein